MAFNQPEQNASGLTSRAIAWLKSAFAPNKHFHLLSHIKDYVPGSEGMVVHGAGAPWHNPQLATNSDLSAHIGNTSNPHSTSDANLVTTDVATNNASASKHGFLKKLSNSATEFMNGQGNWATPSGSGGSGNARLINDGRLSCTDTALTWGGYEIGLYDVAAAGWAARIPSSTPTLANTANDLDSNALVADANYDIYATATDGTTNAMLLVAKKWTNATTRAVTPALWQGVLCYDNTTDAGKRRRFLGTIRLRNDGGVAKFTDDTTRLWVSNYYNTQSKGAYYSVNANGANLTSTSYVLFNSWTSPGVSAVVCIAKPTPVFGSCTIVSGGSDNQRGIRAIYQDGAQIGQDWWNDITHYSQSSYPLATAANLNPGYHYFDIYAKMQGGTGQQWWAELNIMLDA